MADLRTAAILAVGSELLTPHRVDTNSLYLTARLNEFGVRVVAKAVVGDDRAGIARAMGEALAAADLLVTTGGLGPTADDLTREAAADLLGLDLLEDPAVVRAIEARFAARGLAMPANNRRQAFVPAGAAALPNAHGTAPGLWIDTAGRVLLLLPGPTREMQSMFETLVAPRLAPRTGARRLHRRVIRLTGRPESEVDAAAAPVYAELSADPIPVETTILASPGTIELHLSATGDDAAALDARLDAGVEALAAALGPAVYSVDGRALEAVVGDLLLAGRRTIAVAESCTGGLLLGRLTDVPGSSAWVVGGVTAYADRVKVETLGVPEAALAAAGAVSEPVAVAMAAGVRERLGADIGVGVTGIAGPAGGSPDKPVGTVYIAVAGPDGVRARRFTFPGDRAAVRAHAVQAALELVRRALLRP